MTFEKRDWHTFSSCLCYTMRLSTSTRTPRRQRVARPVPSCRGSDRGCARWNSVLRNRRPLMKIDYPSGLVLTPARVKSSRAYTHQHQPGSVVNSYKVSRLAYICWFRGIQGDTFSSIKRRVYSYFYLSDERCVRSSSSEYNHAQ